MALRIVEYDPSREADLFELIRLEGDEWIYWQPDYRDAYRAALAKSTTYLAFAGPDLVGYVRSLDDFLIWIVDLLVASEHRGHGYGQALMQHVAAMRPDHDVYVLGADDAARFYEKCGLKAEGTVYLVAGRNVIKL
ncbi:MAG: GNAT family N-acetyltransferase [Promicromonosporaceae bacterium]|nr:GNAT family N-acetyltransferase [Promicromonosporaceae bacterium]